MSLNYPNPLSLEKYTPLLASTPHRQVFEGLQNGGAYCFEGTYGSAMNFYSWLKKRVNQLQPIVDYPSSRANRIMLWELTQRLIVGIRAGQIDLVNAPQVPWLHEFYPKFDKFYLPFTEVLGMNGSYQWFKNGILYPGLRHRVHPYYGVYFPTRIEHLTLFDEWMKGKGHVKRAMDMGTGSGVLTQYMLKHGTESVLATDINPNALHSLNLDLKGKKGGNRVTLQQSNLFEKVRHLEQMELVVFNPPWIPDSDTQGNDEAMYYSEDFFERFFQSAYTLLPKGCSVVILYSTFAQAAGIIQSHPIEHELSANNRFKLVERVEKQVTQRPSKKKSWLSEIRKQEKVELWVLAR